NDSSSTNEISSATINVPTGYTNVVLGAVTPPSGQSWTASIASGIIALSGTTGSSKLTAGQSVSLAITATSPSTGGIYTWTTSTSGSFDLQGPQPTVTITSTATTTSVSSAPTITYGAHGMVTVTVSAASGTPTGSLSLTVDGTSTFNYTLVSGDSGSHTFDVGALNAGSHSLSASYAGSGSFLASSDNDGDTLAVNKANASISVTGYDVTYNGNAHTATGTATGVNNEDLSSLLNLSGTTHTNAGTYNGDTWTFAGNGNYNSASGTVNDAIAKAATVTTVTINGGPFVYTGQAQTPATVKVTGAGGLSLAPTASYSNNVNAGTATAS